MDIRTDALIRSCRTLFALLLGLGLAGCERSEQVGWADSGRGQLAAAEDGESTGASSDPEASPGLAAAIDPEELAREYYELYEALSPLRTLSFGDEEVQAEWAVLVADVDSSIVERSEFHRKLMERRAEIVARVREVQESGEPMTRGEQMELATHLENIKNEMARIRAIELEQLEFFPRLYEFNMLVFDRMIQLEPLREAEINRLRQLSDQMYMIAPQSSRDLDLQMRLPEESIEPIVIQPGQKPPF